MTALTFAGRTARPATIGIVGFGKIAQVHCQYLLSDLGDQEGQPSVLMIFPGIHDRPDICWPPPISDPKIGRAVNNATILFVEESVATIQPLPGSEGGYMIETSQHEYRFADVYLEPAIASVA